MLATLGAIFVMSISPTGRTLADTTVVYDGADAAAPHISLIGDSTLTGVRWYDDYGDLRRFNFVFDAESCRRTLETSCWSREDYRPENTLAAMERLSGQLGEVLVVMSGYNDSSYLFDDAVDAVVEEARAQGVSHVLWLTLRAVDGVNYEEPMHQANANTYRESNRVLLEKAGEYPGYLEVADWASHSADRSDWFEYDGVHLTEAGVDAVTTYISDSVGSVLGGSDVTPETLPWVTLEQGDSGNTVADAQQALWDAGIVTVGGVDAIFGDQTAQAVAEFQEEHGLQVTGAVDESTAIALGLAEAPTVVERAPYRQPAPTTSAPRAGGATRAGYVHVDRSSRHRPRHHGHGRSRRRGRAGRARTEAAPALDRRGRRAGGAGGGLVDRCADAGDAGEQHRGSGTVRLRAGRTGRSLMAHESSVVRLGVLRVGDRQSIGDRGA